MASLCFKFMNRLVRFTFRSIFASGRKPKCLGMEDNSFRIDTERDGLLYEIS